MAYASIPIPETVGSHPVFIEEMDSLYFRRDYKIILILSYKHLRFHPGPGSEKDFEAIRVHKTLALK